VKPSIKNCIYRLLTIIENTCIPIVLSSSPPFRGGSRLHHLDIQSDYFTIAQRCEALALSQSTQSNPRATAFSSSTLGQIIGWSVVF